MPAHHSVTLVMIACLIAIDIAIASLLDVGFASVALPDIPTWA